MPEIPMLGFRALQAVMDLRAAAGRQSPGALRAVVSLVPPGGDANRSASQRLTRIMLRQGGRFEDASDRSLLDALMLAASQPEHDPGAFAFSIAVLLADRLQQGLGTDDLGAFWSNFSGAYSDLPAPDRAAIVQGFLTGARLGRVRMAGEVPGEAHLTRPADSLRAELLDLAGRRAGDLAAYIDAHLSPVDAALASQHLRGLLAGNQAVPLTGDSLLFSPLLDLASTRSDQTSVAATLVLLSEAVRSRDAEGWFGVTLWQARAADWMRLEGQEAGALVAGLRFLYEADPAWVPHPERLSSPRATPSQPVLPALETSRSNQHPDAHAG